MQSLNELDGNIIPFPTVLSQVNNIYCITVVVFGVIACLWLLATNLFRAHSASTKLLISTIFADLIFCGTCVVTSAKSQVAGGFSSGKLGCLVNYYCIVTPVLVCISTLGVVAWERYQIVCKGNQWSDTKINVLIASTWGFFGLLVAIPLITGNYSSIRLEVNSINCNVSWYDRSPQSLVMTSLIILMVAISFSVVAFSYYNVYMTYRAVTKKKRANQDNQRVVFHKCVALTLCLLVTWTPYYIKIFYEIATGVSSDADWASVGNMSGLLCSVLNPIILCIYDNRVRGNMLSVFKYLKKTPVAKEDSTEAESPLKSVKTVLI